jgi:hypothetical protein
MRALRISIAGTVLLLLLVAANVVPAHAAEPYDPMAPAFATGDLFLEALVSEGTNERLRERYYGMEGVTNAYRWSSSDPRLRGKATSVATWIGWYAPDFVAVSTVSWEFTNPQGSWRGTATGLGTFSGLNLDTAILEGAGAYDGLIAYLIFDWDTHPAGFRGVIFEGEMPPPPSAADSTRPGRAPPWRDTLVRDR